MTVVAFPTELQNPASVALAEAVFLDDEIQKAMAEEFDEETTLAYWLAAAAVLKCNEKLPQEFDNRLAETFEKYCDDSWYEVYIPLAIKEFGLTTLKEAATT